MCGGFAEFFGISPLAIRLIFVLLPSNILLYIILALIMPEE
ncbi:MAG: PspC domain-containing protein [Alkalibacterium sp.]|nr:PspC domain-containing protein [Alkalibacterium sp.]